MEVPGVQQSNTGHADVDCVPLHVGPSSEPSRGAGVRQPALASLAWSRGMLDSLYGFSALAGRAAVDACSALRRRWGT